MLFAVGNTPERKSNLNAGGRVLQETEILLGSPSLAQLQLHPGTGECVPVSAAVIIETGPFESRRQRHCLRRRRDEIDQRERSDADDTEDRCDSYEQLPTINPEHRVPFTGFCLLTNFR